MSAFDMQGDPSEMQDGSAPVQTAPAPVAYAPPAVVGEILVTVDWADNGDAPDLNGFALPETIRLRVSAATEAGGVLDPAGVPIQAALSTSMHPIASALLWLTVMFDASTRLGEVQIPAGTDSGNYYLCWRSLLTNNAPTSQAGILDSTLTID